MARQIPIFPHQTYRNIPIDNATEGNFPSVRVLLFNEHNRLQEENVPVEYYGDDAAHEVRIDLQGGGKSGYIIIG